MLVDFVIIGAQKSGTTSLATQLSKHPDVCFCTRKEPHFFSTANNWKESLKSYHKLFKPTADQKIGEASTSYTFSPEYRHTHERLYAYNPNLKLIYLLRHPVERIMSNYSHSFVRGRCKKPLPNEVLEDPSYVNRSRYALQIMQYLNLFPPKNVCILIFEEFIANQNKILQKIASFLDISEQYYDDVVKEHQNRTIGTRKPKEIRRYLQLFSGLVPKQIRGFLDHYLSPYLIRSLERKPDFSERLKTDLWTLVENDVSKLEEIMGRSLDIWRTFP